MVTWLEELWFDKMVVVMRLLSGKLVVLVTNMLLVLVTSMLLVLVASVLIVLDRLTGAEFGGMA